MPDKHAMTTAQWSHMTEAHQREYVSMHGISIGVSTGAAEECTYGWGDLDSNGYWEFPCDWADGDRRAPLTTDAQRLALQTADWHLAEEHHTIYDHYEAWTKTHSGDRGRSDVTLHAGGSAPKWAEPCLLEHAVEFAAILGIAPHGYRLVPDAVAEAWLADYAATAKARTTTPEEDDIAAALSSKAEVPLKGGS